MKIGVLGLGARGQSLIKNAILPALQEYNMEIAAIYDPYADRVQRASKLIFKKTGKHPIEAKDQHEVLQNPEIQGSHYRVQLGSSYRTGCGSDESRQICRSGSWRRLYH